MGSLCISDQASRIRREERQNQSESKRRGDQGEMRDRMIVSDLVEGKEERDRNETYYPPARDVYVPRTNKPRSLLQELKQAKQTSCNSSALSFQLQLIGEIDLSDQVDSNLSQLTHHSNVQSLPISLPLVQLKPMSPNIHIREGRLLYSQLQNSNARVNNWVSESSVGGRMRDEEEEGGNSVDRRTG